MSRPASCVILANVAATAFSQAALHLILDGHVYLLTLESEFVQVLDYELDHDQWPAGNRDGVAGHRVLVHHGCRQKTAVAVPSFFRLVYG